MFFEHFIPNASTTKKMLKLILIKLELNLKIMKTWEVLTVKNQVQIVGMLEREFKPFG